MRTRVYPPLCSNVLALTLCLIAETVVAGQQSYTDYARVLHVEPVTEVSAVPVRERRCDYSSRAQRADAAFAGDVRSNQPRISLAAAFAEEFRHRERASAMQRCRWITTYEDTERVVAYQVRYSYGGGVFTRRMTKHPGTRVQVRVNLHAPNQR
jgi:uncharacterized protein YcfJ